jgi:PEP-CTERM motif-containing protein
MAYLRSAAFAAAVGVALGASSAAHATFVIDTSCGESKCAAGTDFFNDDANKDVSTFTGTVGGEHSGPAVTVTTTGNVDTGAGFSNITPVKGGTLTSLTFTPASDTLFTDFSFRGELNPVGDTSTLDVTWTDSSGTSGTLAFTGLAGPNADFARLGIVSTDETLKSVVVSTTSGESFKEFKQVQFSGAGLVPSIPEPSTWAMMMVGFAGLGYVGFRRSKKDRLAALA